MTEVLGWLGRHSDPGPLHFYSLPPESPHSSAASSQPTLTNYHSSQSTLYSDSCPSPLSPPHRLPVSSKGRFLRPLNSFWFYFSFPETSCPLLTNVPTHLWLHIDFQLWNTLHILYFSWKTFIHLTHHLCGFPQIPNQHYSYSMPIYSHTPQHRVLQYLYTTV